MPNNLRVLFIGDIVGSPGRDAVKALVPSLREEYRLDFVIANAENAAAGSGIIPRLADELFDAGVDVLTSGDHIWKKAEILEVIDKDPRILRPANFPSVAPGKGTGVYLSREGKKLGVVNVQGRVFMEALECPFKAALAAAEALKTQTRCIVVDMHAEATSEKVAMGWLLDGKVSAVLGSHTHIQTADEKILPLGTAYLSDAGMTGPYRSVIGREIEPVLSKFLSGVPKKFEVAREDVQLHGAVVEISPETGNAVSIVRIQRKKT
jgi:2',3'-cyclic-nucleotide 2'-phosphodiesterase